MKQKFIMTQANNKLLVLSLSDINLGMYNAQTERINIQFQGHFLLILRADSFLVYKYFLLE